MSEAFASLSTPSIEVTSLDCGPSGSDMKLEHTQFGENRFPTLPWPPATTDIKEYILIREDADIPFPGGIAHRIIHRMFYAIPPSTTTVASSDFQATSTNNRGGHVKGGLSDSRRRIDKIHILDRGLHSGMDLIDTSISWCL